MENKKILSLALMAFVFSLVAISTQTTATDELYNFIAGDNINISTNGNNITISASNTFTYSNVNLTNVNLTGNVYINSYNASNLSSTLSYLSSTLSSFGISLSFLADTVQALGITVDGISNELPSLRQMAFEVDINTSFTSDDFVLIPYDFYINNVTTQLNNNAGYFNYSIIKYTTYPTGNSTIGTINTSNYLNVSYIGNPEINQYDVIELRYNNYSNVSRAIILFELEKI